MRRVRELVTSVLTPPVRGVVLRWSRAATAGRRVVRRGRPVPWSRLRRILVIEPGGLADAVCGIPVHRHLRERCPDARLELVGTPLTVRYLGLHPWYDVLHTGTGTVTGDDVDLLIALGASGRVAWEHVRVAAPRAIGYLHAPRADRVGVAVAGPPPDARALHRVDARRGVLAWLGEPVSDAPARPSIPPDEARLAAHALEAAGVGDRPSGIRPPLVALAPGARHPVKAWDPAEVETFVGSLLVTGARIVVLGDEEDRARTRRWAGPFVDRPGFAILAGLPLVHSIAILDRVDVVVAADNGLAHVAGLLGRPTITLHGPTDPARRGPYWGPVDPIPHGDPADGRFDGVRYPRVPSGMTLTRHPATDVLDRTGALLRSIDTAR